MRDDFVPTFQRYSRVVIEMKEHPTDDLRVKRAMLALSMGQPDDALEQARELLDSSDTLDVAKREAAHVLVLACCLRAAVLEGDAEGMAGWNPLRKGPKAETCRRNAIEVLESLKDRDGDEDLLLERLEKGYSLACVSLLIASDPYRT